MAILIANNGRIMFSAASLPDAPINSPGQCSAVAQDMRAASVRLSGAIAKPVLPLLLLPSWLRRKSRSGPSGRAGIEAGGTISVRFGAVNRKMDKLTQVQAVTSAW